MKASLPILLAFAAPAAAQSIVAPDDTRQAVVALSLTDGSLQAGGYIDLDDGTTNSNRPYDTVRVGDELWFSDGVLGTIQRWNSFGTVQVGEIDLAPQRLRGMEVAFGSVWVAGGNPALPQPDFLFELSTNGAILNQYPMPGFITGVSRFGNELLVSHSDVDDILRVNPNTGAVAGTFHASNGVSGIDFPEDIHVRTNGNVLVAGGLAPAGIYEYDPSGNQIDYFDTSSLPLGGGVRGVQPTNDGNIAFTAATGVYVYDVANDTITERIDSMRCYYMTVLPSLPIGTPECMANPNSTGQTGVIQAFGSEDISDSALRLCVSDLPDAATGYFLVSRSAGFVANPGGSQGNLCLSGAIGRYVTQVGFTQADGFFSFTIDPAAMPQPNGFVPTVAGETWRFQCWHRDANPNPTSNFSNVTAVTLQ